MKLPVSVLIMIFLPLFTVCPQQISVDGIPGQIEIRKAGSSSIRITIKPQDLKDNFPYSPAIAEKDYPEPVIKLQRVDQPVKKSIGTLNVELHPDPLTITVKNRAGREVQKLAVFPDGIISFKLYGQPVLGMGEGGSLPGEGADWKNLPVEYDRRGRYDKMQPRWQSDAYGSRNPAAMLIEPGSWAIFVSLPWMEVDLRDKETGFFIPWKPSGNENVPQNMKNQRLNQGKGLPPADKVVPGLIDFFVFDAGEPEKLMKDYSEITGPAVLPPKWALGYMQSHRTLENETQLYAVVDSFRKKRIPLDAVIYLGTGFTPRGWNKPQPSFEFNPEVFTSTPADFFSAMHNRNVKVVLHMVPWDRDKLPSLQGTIPAKPGEPLDASHIQNYWNEHVPLVKAGADAFWPDEGDWFNLFERIKRHQLYYQGYLFTNPDVRPWSLQRNGYPGIAQWGGWVWSGDTQSSWKSLEAQIAVGLNYSMSIGPFWGSDIGGFYSNEELTGELYARWFQFGAFCPSFRSHGRTWWTRLPWGWGLSDMGPKEVNTPPLQSEMNNTAIEPIVKKFTELRYHLLPYNYTLAWEARNMGMPMMRAMWMHYPMDEQARKIGDQYLWGRDILIAPVYQKGAVSRKVYLPEGSWYDWWTYKMEKGNRTIVRDVDLTIIPIYVKAGAIIPLDTVRQYTAEVISSPTTLRIFTGTDGSQVLYDDDGISQKYLSAKTDYINIKWDDMKRILKIYSESPEIFISGTGSRTFRIQLIPGNETKTVDFRGRPVSVRF